MLFSVKNHLWLTLPLLALFVAAALGAQPIVGLTWNWDWQPLDLLLGLLVMGISDAALHVAFTFMLGETYLSRYRALAEYFRPQQAPQIVAGGLLAGGEELIFRGVLLEGLRSRAGLSSVAAIGISAVIFGLLHAIPRRPLLPFAAWAVWEGVLLGVVYVASGSLLVVVVLHLLHDIVGFSAFAVQRRMWN